MSDSQGSETDEREAPEAVVKARAGLSIVWLIPVVAAAIGGWLAYRAYSEQGPSITITFKSAEGLEAGKTKLKYKDVELGVVESITLAKGLSHVNVEALLVNGTERYLTEKTRFWVERARVSAGRVSGLGTLLSGAYIGIDPVAEGKSQRKFTGLDNPPLVTSELPGRRFVLQAPRRGSLDAGSPVYFRQVAVGQVIRSVLNENGESVTIDIFVNAPHDKLVRKTTRFWNVSGINVALDADGVRLDTESIVSMLIGGVAFETPALEPGDEAEPLTVFPLYPDLQATAVRIYEIKQRYLVHFDGSVKGLVTGAPVEFRGIRIGQVVDVKLEFDGTEFRIPVVIEIEPERITVVGTEPPDISGRLTRLVERGLRAQLKSANLLTGRLVVDLNIYPDAPEAVVKLGGLYPELPTVPTPLDQITTSLTRLVGRIDALPLENLGADLQKSMAALRVTLEHTGDLTRNANVTVLPAVTEVIEEAKKTLSSTTALLGPEAPLTQELSKLLVDLSEAAQSVRRLADELEQHPENLLRGKGKGQ